MKKSGLVIVFSLMAGVLISVLAGCQNSIEGIDLGSETYTLNTGPTTGGGYGGGSSRLVVPNFSTLPGGYTGPATITYYNPDAALSVTVTAAGTLEYDSSLTLPTGAVKSITLTDPSPAKTHLIGRAPTAGAPLVLKVNAAGALSFRPGVLDAVDSKTKIPIGAYAEFQLINLSLLGGYKQEADLDLMGGEPGVSNWTPVGTTGSEFTGTYDGGGKKLTRLKIDTPSSTTPVGLFGHVGSTGVVKNLGIDSGAVKGNTNVGAVAGINSGAIIACYNAAEVRGNNSVGGVAGSAGTITACYNSGRVGGNSGSTGANIGGLAGTLVSGSSLTACYNTGTLTGSSNIGGLVGNRQGSGTWSNNCYWKGLGSSGVGSGTSAPLSGTYSFATYFTPTTNTEWGTGDGSGSGKYWKAGIIYNSALPRLWFE